MSKKNGPEKKHFSIISQRPNPQEKQKRNPKVQKKLAQNETFFNFFPTPQPPGTLKPFPRAKARDGGVVGQIFIQFGQNGAPVMPI